MIRPGLTAAHAPPGRPEPPRPDSPRSPTARWSPAGAADGGGPVGRPSPVRLQEDGRRRRRPDPRPATATSSAWSTATACPIGFALWNGRSQIASAILLAAGVEPPGPAFWDGRIDEAIALRRDVLKLDETTDAYRVLHAEGDGLSGLIVDRFADVLSVEIFSLGMYQRIGPILELLAARLGTKHFRVHVDERIALAEDFPGRPVATPEAAAPGDDPRARGPLPRPVRGGPQDRLLLRPARQPPRPGPVHCADRTVLDLCCYTGGFGLNALVRGKAREVTCVDLDEKAIALAKENANLNQVKPVVRPRRRLRLHAADGPERPDLRRGRARPAQADPRPAGHRLGQAEILRPERAGDEAGRARRHAPDVLLLGPAAGRGVPRSCSAPPPARPAARRRSWP